MKHIAQSGAKAGQWVHCPAKIKCTIQGTIHASENDIEKVRLWKQDETNGGKYLKVSSITKQDYLDYQRLSDEDREIVDQIFNDRLEEAAKRRAPQTDASKQTDTVKLGSELIAKRHNYSQAQIIEAQKSIELYHETVEKWKQGVLTRTEITQYVDNISGKTLWEQDEWIIDTVAAGLRYHDLKTLRGARNIIATDRLMRLVHSSDLDAIKGVKPGSH